MGSTTRRLSSLGFTLLELLIALAIAAAVVLGLQAAVGIVTDVASRGRDRAAESLRAEAAREAIRSWLAGAFVGGDERGPGFEGRDRLYLGLPDDEVAFLTADPGLLTGVPEVPMQIRLRVVKGADGGLVADYAPHEGPGSGGSLTVMPQVRGMNVRYLIRLGEEQRWLDAWSSQVRLPTAVEFEFFAAEDEGVADAIRLRLLVPLARRG